MSALVIDTSGSQLDAFRTQCIVDHVKHRWKLAGCALCQSTSFVLLAQITMRYYDAPNVLSGDGPEHPCAGIVCRGCGDVRVLDLVVTGIWDAVPVEGAPRSGPYR